MVMIEKNTTMTYTNSELHDNNDSRKCKIYTGTSTELRGGDYFHAQ